MSKLTPGTTIDGHEVLHDGNHLCLKSPHLQYSSMIPEFYTEGVGKGYYVKLIETILETGGEGHKEFYDVTVTNLGSGVTTNPEYYTVWLRVTRYDGITFKAGVDYHNTQDMSKPIIKVVSKVVGSSTVITLFVKNGGGANATISLKPNIIYPADARLNLIKHSDVLSDSDFETYSNGSTVTELSGNYKFFGDLTVNGKLNIQGMTYINNTLRSNSPATVDIGTDYTRFNNIFGTNFVGYNSNIDIMTGGKITVNEGRFNTFIKLPVATTRPTSPSNGCVMFDSGLQKWIYYMGTQWLDLITNAPV